MSLTMEHQAAIRGGDGAWPLLAELNHRVCNELQAASSALRLARRGLSVADSMRFIDEAIFRLEAFGFVHKLLDRHRQQGTLAQRLEALCQATSVAKTTPLGIHLKVSLEDVPVDDEISWTVCVVTCELLTNAVKYAFSEGSPGVVSVVLKQDRGKVLLIVSDDGIGCRSAETIRAMPGLGHRIVSQLAERLGGFVTRVSGTGGTTVTFGVPIGLCVQ